MINTIFTKQVGIDIPIICGAMYPCSNPELVASASDAGGIGVVQPLSLVYVYGYDFKKGLQYIRSLTQKPFGMNVLVEKSSKLYENRMKQWVDIALEEGCRFFITALGNPKWVLNQVKSAGSIVYHDVTNRTWALKALEYGVDGLICVNNRAGGHAGTQSPQELYTELQDLKVPLICAGGVGFKKDFLEALNLGYAGVQMGTRFIATHECSAHEDYKQAIINADEKDIVLTERVTGVPLSIIRTPYVEKEGLKVGPIARYFFKNPRTKHWIRTLYNLRAIIQMKRSVLKGLSTKDYYQAGKSVSGIDKIERVADIIKCFGES